MLGATTCPQPYADSKPAAKCAPISGSVDTHHDTPPRRDLVSLSAMRTSALVAGATEYRVDATTGAEKVIHSFKGMHTTSDPQAGSIVRSNLLYGISRVGGTHQLGAVFSLDPATGDLTVLHSLARTDGEDPGGLVYNQGAFYGTTYGGGASGFGTVFKLTP